MIIHTSIHDGPSAVDDAPDRVYASPVMYMRCTLCMNANHSYSSICPNHRTSIHDRYDITMTVHRQWTMLYTRQCRSQLQCIDPYVNTCLYTHDISFLLVWKCANGFGQYWKLLERVMTVHRQWTMLLTRV